MQFKSLHMQLANHSQENVVQEQGHVNNNHNHSAVGQGEQEPVWFLPRPFLSHRFVFQEGIHLNKNGFSLALVASPAVHLKLCDQFFSLQTTTMYATGHHILIHRLCRVCIGRRENESYACGKLISLSTLSINFRQSMSSVCGDTRNSFALPVQGMEVQKMKRLEHSSMQLLSLY